MLLTTDPIAKYTTEQMIYIYEIRNVLIRLHIGAFPDQVYAEGIKPKYIGEHLLDAYTEIRNMGFSKEIIAELPKLCCQISRLMSKCLIRMKYSAVDYCDWRQSQNMNSKLYSCEQYPDFAFMQDVIARHNAKVIAFMEANLNDHIKAYEKGEDAAAN